MRVVKKLKSCVLFSVFYPTTRWLLVYDSVLNLISLPYRPSFGAIGRYALSLLQLCVSAVCENMAARGWT